MQIMEGSKKFTEMKKRYYFDHNEDHPSPHVVVFGESATIVREGQGWEKEDITVKVWFHHKAKKKTRTKYLYRELERLRALLHVQPRLGDSDGSLTDCTRAIVTGWRQLFGSHAGYLIDIMEVTIDVWLHKRY